MVRWRVPKGRIAFSGIRTVDPSVGLTASAVKCSSEVSSNGLEEMVTRGRQRKCVNGGLGGIPSLRSGEMSYRVTNGACFIDMQSAYNTEARHRKVVFCKIEWLRDMEHKMLIASTESGVFMKEQLTSR